MKHIGNSEDEGDEYHAGIFGQKTELIFSIICGLFLGLGFLIQNVFLQVSKIRN